LLAPADTTLLGCDGLVRVGNSTLIAVQNGVRPARILRLALDPSNSVVTDVTVLAAGHPAMLDVALGCLVDDKFVFIGDAGWNRHGPNASVPPGPRPVPILSVGVMP